MGRWRGLGVGGGASVGGRSRTSGAAAEDRVSTVTTTNTGMPTESALLSLICSRLGAGPVLRSVSMATVVPLD